MKTINASEFKKKCLALLDEVYEAGEVLTVLEHGRPVAQLVPPAPRSEGYPQASLVGTVEFLGDVDGPVPPAEVGDAEREKVP
jgi:antitoxin (DNA-binding transcriptional repressor) of toxin-antitoxin stability system